MEISGEIIIIFILVFVRAIFCVRHGQAWVVRCLNTRSAMYLPDRRGEIGVRS
jgi:hypothetical protein